MKTKITRIVVAAVLLVVAVGVEHMGQLAVWQLLLVYLVPYLVAGYDVVGEAIEGLCHGEALDEDVLMTSPRWAHSSSVSCREQKRSFPKRCS